MKTKTKSPPKNNDMDNGRKLEVFIKTPINIEPDEPGDYILIKETNYSFATDVCYYNGRIFIGSEKKAFTHWLRKEII